MSYDQTTGGTVRQNLLAMKWILYLWALEVCFLRDKKITWIARIKETSNSIGRGL